MDISKWLLKLRTMKIQMLFGFDSIVAIFALGVYMFMVLRPLAICIILHTITYFIAMTRAAVNHLNCSGH